MHAPRLRRASNALCGAGPNKSEVPSSSADADENGAGLLRPAPAHDGEYALDVAAPQIGGNP